MRYRVKWNSEHEDFTSINQAMGHVLLVMLRGASDVNIAIVRT